MLPIGESPIRVKVSHHPVTEFCMAGGNKCHEARRREISGRNASEGIEPRNETNVWRSRYSSDAKTELLQP